jgi:hypothetical protein
MTEPLSPSSAGSVDEAPTTTVIVCVGCKGPCDFTGWIDIVEPTTGRVCGGTQVCKTCGMLSIDHSLRYGE